MTTKNKNMRPAPLALFIATVLASSSQVLYASESFNTELVELDNPEWAKPTYLLLNPALRLQVRTMLTSFLTTS
jgi:hypothetical protein